MPHLWANVELPKLFHVTEPRQVVALYLPTVKSRKSCQKQPVPDSMQACLHVSKYTHLTRTATPAVILIWELRLRASG